MNISHFYASCNRLVISVYIYMCVCVCVPVFSKFIIYESLISANQRENPTIIIITIITIVFRDIHRGMDHIVTVPTLSLPL